MLATTRIRTQHRIINRTMQRANPIFYTIVDVMPATIKQVTIYIKTYVIESDTIILC